MWNRERAVTRSYLRYIKEVKSEHTFRDQKEEKGGSP